MNQKFVNYLNEQYVRFAIQHNMKTTQNAWARELGVSPANLSTWMLGQREPTAANIHQLAKKLGPSVYDALDMPILIPDDPIIRQYINLFVQASSKTQKEVIALLHEEDKKVKEKIERARNSEET